MSGEPWRLAPKAPEPKRKTSGRWLLKAEARAFIIFNDAGWVYNGVRFVSTLAKGWSEVLPLGDMGTAEGMAHHLRGLGFRAWCRRATYAEQRDIESETIRAAAPGEKVLQSRFRRKAEDEEGDPSAYLGNGD